MTDTATKRGAGSPAPLRAPLQKVAKGFGIAPFAAYTTVFLGLPTLFVVVGAFINKSGQFDLNGFAIAFSPLTLKILWNSIWVSALTAVVGAFIGGLVAYALSTAPKGSVMRRVFVALNSVLAQFGGVMLAFAFIATLGNNGMVTLLLQQIGVQTDAAFLSTLVGVCAVYAYFQIPLMVIVFLPAVDGLRPQWREAASNLGATDRQFWFRIGFPVLAPSFLGGMLLLFANSFSAFATAAALISQQTIIVPMEIESAIRNENNPGLDTYAKALALIMIVVVAVVMALYAYTQRRASRWLS